MRSEHSLVFLKNFLGDTVLATPLLRVLAETYQRPLVLASNQVQQVLADPSMDFEYSVPRELKRVGEFLKQVHELRGRNIKVAFLVNRSFRSALAVRMAGIPVRIGHATEGRRLLLTHPVPYDLKAPETECYADLARAIGLPVSDLLPRLYVSEAEKAEGLARLNGAEVGIQPGARYVDKQVPVATMLEVARGLQLDGRRVALVGGPDEVDAGQRFESELGDCVNLVGQTKLRETLGVLASLKVMVGSDTGVMHLAAGAGCPTVTVFGPNPAVKWGHFQPPHHVIEAPSGDVSKVPSSEILEGAFAALKQC